MKPTQNSVPIEYRSLLILMREIQITSGAIASFTETRAAVTPVNDEFIRTRVDYIEAKLEALKKELNHD